MRIHRSDSGIESKDFTRRRIERAKELLWNSKLPITEIAL